MSGHTPGPWKAYRMTNANTGELFTPDEVGEYVANTVRKSAEESGTIDFLFIGCEKDSGPADVCHVGNGPTSPANARLIAAAPEMLEALESVADQLNGTAVLRDGSGPLTRAAEVRSEDLRHWAALLYAAIAKATGEVRT